MTTSAIKPGNTEISFTAANTVYAARTVRLCNPSASAILITVAGTTPASTNGTFTIRAGDDVTVSKQTTDTIAANAAILATPVAWL